VSGGGERTHPPREVARRARRIVVKVGSSVLTREGALRTRVFGDVARQVSALCDAGREVVVVSSGAIAVGSRELGWKVPGGSIPEKQAAAAVGQIGLVEIYRRRFARHGRRVAQILVTRTGLEDRERFLNARHTLMTLLGFGVVPIVNENDTVATEEIRFGDNDNLSATVVNLVGADLLVILTDVDGLYTRPPAPGGPPARKGEAERDAGRRRAGPPGEPQASERTPPAPEGPTAGSGEDAPPRLFDVVESVGAEVERAAQGSSSAFGRGGMTTKLQAAQAAARCGASTVLCNGNARDVLLRVSAGEAVGTLFLAGSRLASRKHWLAFTLGTRGQLVIDPGAARALVERGKSLLAAGIVEVRGKFGIGDPVACVDATGRELARGLVAYGSEEIRRIARRPAREIPRVLGYSNGDEVIHRDDLVLVEGPPQ
jgi:glutamate 5-kinase